MAAPEPDNRKDKLEDGKIRMNKCLRKNIRCRLGDMVFVKIAPDIPNAKKIHVLPFADNFESSKDWD